jgi:solute carrier family 6 amino acid transporter-like protein 5/7/9/14
VILLIRGVTLPGAVDGIYVFLTPDWSKLLEIGVWTDAATHIFYSLGPGFGGLITLASYNKRNSNCQRDAVLIALANSGTSIFAGFVIFSILGFMAKELNVPVSEVVEGGTALAFVAYPTAITKLPVSPLWSFLFFSMLLTLGLDSQFTTVETIITAIYDEFPRMRNWKLTVVGGVSAIGFLLGIPMCLQGGYYLFVLMDWYSGSLSLILLSVTEIVLISWVYGTVDFNKDIKSMGLYQNRYIQAYWNSCWKFTSPVLLTLVLIFTLAEYHPASDGDYEFPLWSNIVGWFIALSSVFITVPFGAYEVIKNYRNGWPLRKLIDFDYVWRTQSRALCEGASNTRADDSALRKDALSPENLLRRDLLMSHVKLGRSDEKVIMSSLKSYKQ